MSNKELIEKMRERLNAKKGNDSYAKVFGENESLLNVKNWIPLKPFFKHATGGDGFPCGHITQIIGESDSGKSTLMMEGIVACQKMGGLTYLIDSEHKFSMQRLSQMGGDPTALTVLQVDSLEESWDAIKNVIEGIEELRSEGVDVPVLVCWDSIAGSTPQKIMDEEEAGDAHVALEAKINNKNIRKLRASISKNDIALVGINHFYTTMPAPGKPPKEVIKGGEELYFMSTLILKTRKGAKIERGVKGETQKLGRVTKFEVVKGHFHGRTIASDVYVVDIGILENKEQLEEYKKTLRGDF